MKKLALIGKDISHSLSPALFNAAGLLIDGSSYDLIDSANLSKAMEFIKTGLYNGANITAPFKEEILAYCNEFDPSVKATGASNLIVKSGDSFKAFNTDTFGAYGPFEARGTKPSRVLIAGAGGASKAAAYIFSQKGFEISIVNRNWEKAKEVAQKFNSGTIEITDLQDKITQFDIFIYTIPVPITQLEQVDFQNIIIAEANYKKPVLDKIKCKEYINGLEWLVNQAIPGFKLLTGKEPDTKAMFEMVQNG